MEQDTQMTQTVEKEPTERPPMHRVGSVKGRIVEPKNLNERLISRRLELNMSQGKVAEQVWFWNAQLQEQVELSRSAYCMYESGDVVPNLAKIVQIAAALRCDPAWLAFGKGNRSEIEEIDFSPDTTEFVTTGFQVIREDWLRETFGVEPSEIILSVAADSTPSLRAGDIAIVVKGIEPSPNMAEFVFVEGDRFTIAPVTKRGTAHRIYDPAGRSHREVPIGSLKFLGKVVGKQGPI